MQEKELLRHIGKRSADLGATFSCVEVGPGDDCAVVGVPARVLLKVDQVVEGRHFVRGTAMDSVARKAIARAVSDVAAMAGTPIAAMASVVLPQGFQGADELFDRMSHWARHFGCPLVGGDIVIDARDGLVLSVSVVGTLHATRGAVLRSGARAGDGVYVTGRLGGSFEQATGLGRHLTFEPRVREATILATTIGERLHAMMDLSDGLGLDSGRLAEASGVRLEMNADAIPLACGVRDWIQACGDGEDYELLFTAATGASPERCPLDGTLVTRIGRVVSGSGSVVKDGAALIDVTNLGYEHGARGGAT
jgi:thiamine-monophosphate kinase